MAEVAFEWLVGGFIVFKVTNFIGAGFDFLLLAMINTMQSFVS